MVKLYAIMDTKAEFASMPIPARTDAEARREFSIVAADRNTQIGRHPEDFVLCYIGEYDQEKMSLKPDVGHVVAKGIEFINKGRDLVVGDLEVIK